MGTEQCLGNNNKNDNKDEGQKSHLSIFLNNLNISEAMKKHVKSLFIASNAKAGIISVGKISFDIVRKVSSLDPWFETSLFILLAMQLMNLLKTYQTFEMK